MSTTLTVNSTLSDEQTKGVLVIDSDKKIVFADDQAAKLLGFNAGDLIGRLCSEFSRELPCANGFCTLESACRFMDSAAPSEVSVKSNDKCTFESRVAVNSTGERVGLVHVVSLPKPKHPHERRLKKGELFHGMVGSHPSMERLFELISLVAATDVTVHIYGPSGVGKELIAEAIHQLSDRASHRLVKLNCSTIPATLLESTLFGHARGSFTGANKDTEGYVEYAEGGTLFLDEIGDVSQEVQVKLLRLLESREFARVGETRTRVADIRIVTATNQDLRKLVQEGKIREDFFYRVNVFPLTVPPLKDRGDDITALANFFVDKFNKRLKKNILGVSPEALTLLHRHRWPGNVRELQHAIEHAFVKAANGYLLPEHFPIVLENDQTTGPRESPAGGAPPSGGLTEATIQAALDKTGGNVSKAGGLLGVSRVTVWKYMKRFGLNARRARS